MSRCAAFTMVHDERYHLPQWIAYYSQHIDAEDLYILDHQSTDPATVAALEAFNGNVIPVTNDVVFDHEWLLQTVQSTQARLLEDYDYVLYTDTDELVIPANGTLRDFIAHADQPAYRCTGYELIHDQMHHSEMYNKTLLAAHPLTWNYGYHSSIPEYPANGDLFLYHLHRMDFDEAWAKNMRLAQKQWDATAITYGFSIQNQHTDIERFKQWFYDTGGRPLEPLHERLTAALANIPK